MRRILLLPLTASVAVGAACGSASKEQTAHAPLQRDLTLVTATAAEGVASRMETSRPQTLHRKPQRRVGPSARPLAPPKAIPAASWAPAVVRITPTPLAEPESQPAPAGDDRELLPGKTVTLIPASSGPSISRDPGEDVPEGRSARARRGGSCGGRGRGPDIGVVGSPRPDFR